MNSCWAQLEFLIHQDMVEPPGSQKTALEQCVEDLDGVNTKLRSLERTAVLSASILTMWEVTGMEAALMAPVRTTAVPPLSSFSATKWLMESLACLWSGLALSFSIVVGE